MPASPVLPNLVQVSNQLSTNTQFQQKAHYPESFTNLALYNRILEKVQCIENIVARLNGRDCLRDDSLFMEDDLIAMSGLYEILSSLTPINSPLRDIITCAWDEIKLHSQRIEVDAHVQVLKSLCPVNLSSFGANSQREMSVDIRQYRDYCAPRYNDFTRALITQVKRCLFFNAFLDNEAAQLAISL